MKKIFISIFLGLVLGCSHEIDDQQMFGGDLNNSRNYKEN